MDIHEATRIVFSRIQSIDPKNASKIMGLLLIQDNGEKEIIRLAFGPEAMFRSVILQARRDLGVGVSPTSPSTPPSPSPFLHNPMPIPRQNSSSFSSSRLHNSISPSSPWAHPSTYSDAQNFHELTDPMNLTSQTSASANNHPNTSSASYAAVVAAMNGFNSPNAANNMAVGSSAPSDLITDEFQLQDQLSFPDPSIDPKNSDLFYPPPPQATNLDNSPNHNNDAMLFPPYWAGGASPLSNGNHRRSCSVSDMCLGPSDPLDSSLGWKPCHYYARGFCKNGTSCRFLHGFPDSPDANSMAGSPREQDVMDHCQELLLLRSKAQQQQQLRSQLLGSSTFPYSPTGANSNCMNFLLQQQHNDVQREALMLGENAHRFGPRNRMERNEYLNSLGELEMNSVSRQIYLTFPADSTFREEDVSNYFSIYGPVQDVRIPYQQKRMFGFVTFVYPETVKLILAKGNPHFVCDARVLVKPYKEKGKVPDKKQQQQLRQMERGEFSVCTSPSGLDSRDPFDHQLGGRMYNSATQDMILRRKLEEQMELQQAIELQSQRFMGLQLLDARKHHHHPHLHPHHFQRNLSFPPPAFSPHMNYDPINHHSSSSDRSSPESNEDNCLSPSIGDEQKVNANVEKEEDNGNGNSNENLEHNQTVVPDRPEHNLPDSPFASPTKSGGNASSFFSTTVTASVSPLAM